MVSGLIVGSMLPLFFSVILLWVTSLSMIRDRTISKYLAFFVLGIVLVFQSTFMVFGVFWNWAWIILEGSVFLNLIWVFVNLRRFAK